MEILHIILDIIFIFLAIIYLITRIKDMKLNTEIKQKTGKWIHHSVTEGFKYERTPYECSCCNKFERETSNFCPNCGVKMESEE